VKKSATLLTAIIFCVLFAVSAFAQDNSATPPATKSEDTKKSDTNPFLTDWEVTIDAPGQTLTGKLKIEKDGETFKGILTTEMGDSMIKNVVIKDNSFTGDISVNAQGQAFEGTIVGKVTEDKLSGEINLAGLGAISYTGKKPEKK
jgi:hypothetical protein